MSASRTALTAMIFRFTLQTTNCATPRRRPSSVDKIPLFAATVACVLQRTHRRPSPNARRNPGCPIRDFPLPKHNPELRPQPVTIKNTLRRAVQPARPFRSGGMSSLEDRPSRLRTLPPPDSARGGPANHSVAYNVRRSSPARRCPVLSSASKSGGNKKKSAARAITTVIPTSSPSV